MAQIYSIICLISVWLISLLNQSGWASITKFPDKVNLGVLVLSVYYYLRRPETRLDISSKLVFGIILTFIVIPYLTVNSLEGASYLISFLIVYVVSQFKITETVVKYTAYIIGILGLGVLYDYTRGGFFAGWNDNAMSMVGLFSFIYFTIYLIQEKGTKLFWIFNIVTVIYIAMLQKCDCRSGILFSMLTVVAIIFNHISEKYLQRKNIRFLILNFPLIIALIVIHIAASPYFLQLNRWSYEKFQKPIFNGRDELWNLGLMYMAESDYLGVGKFYWNYHNSAIGALAVFGIVGYICWIKFFSSNLKHLQDYLSDNIVFGCMLAFVLIFMQQAFDLGFISPIPQLLPYAILGMGLGRVRYLKENEEYYG